MKRTDYYEMSFEILERRNYSENTMNIYLPIIDQFLKQVGVPPTRIKAEHFQLFISNYPFTSRSKQNQVISAMKFLYEQVMGHQYLKVDFKRPRGEKKLPRVIDHDLIVSKLEQIENIKHKAILSLIYSAGLRISEAINLKIEDVDSDRMLFHIRNAKGRKDRFVPISPKILQLLRDYFIKERPSLYLFNGQGGKLRYSATSIRKIMKRCISETHKVHELRHSFATHLIEQDVALPKVSKLLGHRSTRTTEIYTHLSMKSLREIKMPI